MTMTSIELKSALEAIIYVADQLASVLGEEKHVVRAALDELVASYANDERGVEIRAVAGGYRVYTKPQHHDLVRRFIKSLRPPLRLTMPALETLAVIAYKQPVTQPEIQEIRGVNCAGVIETLLEKRLVTTAGRKQVIGRPILYRTSKDFLMRFGLSDLEELPSLKEFEQLAQAALGADEGIAPIEPEPGETQGEIQSSQSAEAAGSNGAGLHDSMPLRAQHHGTALHEPANSLGATLDDSMPLGGESEGISERNESVEPKVSAAAAGISSSTATSELVQDDLNSAADEPKDQSTDSHGD